MLAAQHESGPRVDQVVIAVACDVVDEILDGLEREHARQRQYGGDRIERRDGRYELKYEQHDEVGVRQPLELFEQVLGQKGDHIVLGRGHGIILKRCDVSDK